MAELFGRDRTVIGRHISNVFKDGELPEKKNVHFLRIAHFFNPTSATVTSIVVGGCGARPFRRASPAVPSRRWITTGASARLFDFQTFDFPSEETT